VLPALVVDFLGGDTARAAETYGLFATAWALMQFVASPVLGALSDRFGRRPIILTSIAGLGLDYILMALRISAGCSPAASLSGFTSASFATVAAYIADVTQSTSAKGFDDKLRSDWASRQPAFGAARMINRGSPSGLPRRSASTCYGLCAESLPRERRSPTFSWARANPLGSLRLLRSHPELFGLAGVTLLYYVSHEVLPSTFVLYTSYRYGWDTGTVGLALALVGTCTAVVQGGLVGPIVARIGERRPPLTGLTFGVAAFAIYGLAPRGTLFSVPSWPSGDSWPSAQDS
jgi:DHA1 family tetracycline resistance protein-like MFS transporter